MNGRSSPWRQLLQGLRPCYFREVSRRWMTAMMTLQANNHAAEPNKRCGPPAKSPQIGLGGFFCFQNSGSFEGRKTKLPSGCDGASIRV